jgi:hypothetical protein
MPYQRPERDRSVRIFWYDDADDCWKRYLACLAAGITPRFRQWQGKGSVVKWVRRKNLIRRHMTASQRAIVAESLEKLIAEEIAATTQSRHASTDRVGNIANTVHLSRSATVEAARTAGVSEGYVKDARKIAEASPETAQQVLNGVKTIPHVRLHRPVRGGDRRRGPAHRAGRRTDRDRRAGGRGQGRPALARYGDGMTGLYTIAAVRQGSVTDGDAGDVLTRACGEEATRVAKNQHTHGKPR